MHAHSTKHPGEHLVSKHGFEEPEGSKVKRLKQSLNIIETAMERFRAQSLRQKEELFGEISMLSDSSVALKLVIL